MTYFVIDPTTKRAIAGAVLAAVGSAPLGVMLVLRRMSLMGDIIAHAILPGTAAGFIVAGMSMAAMSFGGLVAGLLVALVAGLATRFTSVREDASLASFYILSVAVGVLMMALYGSAEELEDVLFGNANAIGADMLQGMAITTVVTMGVLAVIYRPLVVESFDPVFMKSVRGNGGAYHVAFMMLVVLNMVQSYRTLGTLMASGVLLLPAITAQFWCRRLGSLMILSAIVALIGAVVGICLAAAWQVPSGPVIVLLIGGVYAFSMLFGRHGSVRARYFPFRHLER